MKWLVDPQIWIAPLTLTVLGIVLSTDNVVLMFSWPIPRPMGMGETAKAPLRRKGKTRIS